MTQLVDLAGNAGQAAEATGQAAADVVIAAGALAARAANGNGGFATAAAGAALRQVVILSVTTLITLATAATGGARDVVLPVLAEMARVAATLAMYELTYELQNAHNAQGSLREEMRRLDEAIKALIAVVQQEQQQEQTKGAGKDYLRARVQANLSKAAGSLALLRSAIKGTLSTQRSPDSDNSAHAAEHLRRLQCVFWRLVPIVQRRLPGNTQAALAVGITHHHLHMTVAKFAQARDAVRRAERLRVTNPMPGVRVPASGSYGLRN